jgi:hypothetical protein
MAPDRQPADADIGFFAELSYSLSVGPMHYVAPPQEEGRMYMTRIFATVCAPRAPRSEIIGVRTLLIVVAMLAAATPSFASTVTYDFATRIGASSVLVQDLTLQRVRPGDFLRGTITIDRSIPDQNGSADVGAYFATSAPSVMSLTIGPYGAFPQETFSTSVFIVRIAENGSGFFGTDEISILNSGPFLAHKSQVDNFEIRLDSDSPSFLSGTGFPTAVDLGLLNAKSTFEFSGFNVGDGFQLFGSITEFKVATASVPEPGAWVLMGSGLLTLAALQHRRRHQAAA